jgi:gamma-glutamylcysteine synthetase
MGQEISHSNFNESDYQVFSRSLERESDLLRHWFEQGTLSKRQGVGGFELEAWLVDSRRQPAPINEPLLELLDSHLFSPELSQFNIELNSTPRQLTADALGLMQAELHQNWQSGREAAHKFDADLVMIGILPTLTHEKLTLEYMSNMERYRALNEQVLRLRQGRPLQLEIHGEDHLHTEHHDVMLEAATTSFQVHLQVSQQKSVRYYNAMQILSAPMVAISANSPLLFGKRLWQETRIPLFEQSVALGGFDGAAFGPVKRVSFGTGYARHSLMEVFQENLEHFPILLPVELDEPPETLSHLRLHNGTLWRWNRPLIGFDDDGTPHLRIEHRVIPSGPTVIDTIANAAFFYGLVHALAEAETPPEAGLDFTVVRDNFYLAAKYGLNAPVTWLDGRYGHISDLLQRLLPKAREGLQSLGCDANDINSYLSVLGERLESGINGATWQLRHLEKYGDDMAALVEAYMHNQESGIPVHRWPI